VTSRNSGPRGFAAAALLALAFALVPAAASADSLTVSNTDDQPSGFRCPAAGNEPCTLRSALGQNLTRSCAPVPAPATASILEELRDD
jgi:hypothetical protein